MMTTSTPDPHPAPQSPRRRRSIGLPLLVAALVALLLSSIAGGASAEPVPELPPGVTITVNGLPTTGEEGGKLAGCTLSIAVNGLDPEQSPTDVGVKVNAVSPTTPEGSPATLVDHSTSVDATSWSEDLVMDDLVAPFPIKANGYHLRVLVSLDGTLAATGVYWLACGAAQDGNPTRILFSVEWLTNDGATALVAPEDRLPIGWRDPLLVEGSSHIGEATCTFLPDATQLVCEYDNPGHGDHPGLVVPGNPEATYDVGATGIPTGWTLDETTVGTFVGRETCPRGEDHEELADTAEHEGSFTCTHAVRLVQDPPPPTTTTTSAPGTTQAPTTAPTTAPASDVLAAAVQPTTSASGTLPATGTPSSTLLALGSLLVLAGGAASVVAHRGRRARTSEGA